jgi:hypothetical protein
MFSHIDIEWDIRWGGCSSYQYSMFTATPICKFLLDYIMILPA